MSSKLEGVSKAIVTGGCGFIGSNLVDRLIDLGVNVTAIDNLSAGSLSNIKNSNSKRFTFSKIDCKTDPLDIIKDSDVIFHLAGNPEVRIGSSNTTFDFNDNVLSTYRLLEATRKYAVPNFVFTSTSTVYGEALVLPTPENYSPLIPISTYGGSKLACEAMISSFAHMFAINSTVFRFANVVGAGSRHGVVYDFVKKLGQNPKRLEILGDGTQRKSYIDIEDCVDAMLFALSQRAGVGKTWFDAFNLGSLDTIDVMAIARIVSLELGVDPEYVLTGGVDGGRGWKGDVKTMQLDISKIMKLGWRPKFSSSESIRRAVRSLINDYNLVTTAAVNHPTTMEI